MSKTGVRGATPITFTAALLVGLSLGACTSQEPKEAPDELYAPGVNLRKDAVDGLEVGNRLVNAGEYELAIDAFTRAALEDGMTPDILMGLGTANLGLGRLGQAETLLRRVTKEAPDWPEAWNNLGVVLVERGKLPEAELVLQKAFALDDGQSDSIRDNLRLVLAKSENQGNIPTEEQDYKLVRRGNSDFVIRQTP